jgi:hypothetical protein
MQEFQSVIRSSSVEQAELTYKEACNSPTSKKYLKSMGIGEPTCRVTGKGESYGVLFVEEQKCVANIPTTMQRLQCDCTKT